MGKIITIGREFGSGGREVGKRLSDELGIAYYDNEIITEIAKRTELAEGYVQHVMENGPTALMPITIGRTFYMGADPVMEQNNAIYREQSLLVQELAEKSDCVIVGRSADYILRDKKPLRRAAPRWPASTILSRPTRARRASTPSTGFARSAGKRSTAARKSSPCRSPPRSPRPETTVRCAPQRRWRAHRMARPGRRPDAPAAPVQ